MIGKIYRDGYREFALEISDLWKRRRGKYSGRRSRNGGVSPSKIDDDEEMVRSTSRLLSVVEDDAMQDAADGTRKADQEPLTLQETIKLSLGICLPWFLVRLVRLSQ